MGKVGGKQETSKIWEKEERERCLGKTGRQEKYIGYIRTYCLMREQKNGKKDKFTDKEKHWNAEKERIKKQGKLLRETTIIQFTLVMDQSIVFLLSC